MDWTLKYDGRGFLFELYVNTDEDPMTIVKRLSEAARGPNANAVVIGYRKLTPEVMGMILNSTAEAEISSAMADAKKEPT